MVPLRLAVRYVFSRKSSSIVNLIAAVCVAALSLTVAASLFVLSLQSGLEDFILETYKSVDPPYRVVKKDGTELRRDLLKTFPELKVSARREVNVLLECSGHQMAAVLVGVDTVFCSVTSLSSVIISGRNPIPENSFGILLGKGQAYGLGISSGIIKPVRASTVEKRKGGPFVSIPLLKSVELLPVGIYALDQETDSKYAFAPIQRVDSLLSDSIYATSLEILPDHGFDIDELSSALGSEYEILDSLKIRDSLRKMVNSEKWVIFTMLMFIAMLASLSLAGTISVMRREKNDDIEVLRFLGFSDKSVIKTFFLLGIVLTTLSVVIGILIGLLLVEIQDELGLLSLGGTTFILNYYPVSVDCVLWIETILSIFVIGMAMSFFSSLNTAGKNS